MSQRGRRDVVRQVGNHYECALEEARWIDLQDVLRANGDVVVAGKLGLQPVGEVRVDLDGHQPPRELHQPPGQHAQPWTYLEYVALAIQPRGADDHRGHALVFQERLREALAWPPSQGADTRP